MHKKLGTMLIVLGALCVAGAVSLDLFNRDQGQQAYEIAEARMAPLTEAIARKAQAPARQGSAWEMPEATDSAEDLPEEGILVDGLWYLGYLTIPAMDLQLPVALNLEDDVLEDMPCRYSGGLETKDLVIAAHNYTRQFGEISKLQPGQTVELTDGHGRVHGYQVEQVETLSAYEVERMTAGDWDMTLFTCTYGGRDRWAVRCRQTAE